jgi:hypothetical protein
MSSVVVITPIVIASWPVISAAITAAIGTIGFNVVRDAAGGGFAHAKVQTAAKVKAEIEVEDSEILQTAGAGETMVVEREGIRATFSRDSRGALKVCMEGDQYTKEQLKQVGKDLVDRVTQQYVYHRIVTELKERNMNIVDEEVKADRSVTIRVRNL